MVLHRPIELALHSGQWKKAWEFAALGLLIGVTALSNPATLAILPACVLYSAFERQRGGRPWILPCVALVLALLATISPWILRNTMIFGKLTFIRSNFWLEVELANHPGSQGVGHGTTHPNANRDEWMRYASVGEIAYMADRRQRAIAFIRQNPQRFALLTAVRAFFFWAGLPPQKSSVLSRG